MKKLLVLVAVLALVAAMIAPMAAFASSGPVVTALPNVEVTGALIAPELAVIAPATGIDLGTFVGTGWSNPAFTSSQGVVTITTNSFPDATATLTVQSYDYGPGYDYSAGRMYDGRYMDYPIQMTVAAGTTPVGSGFTYIGNGNNGVGAAAGAATFTSSTTDPKIFNYNLGARQYIDSADLAAGAGNYTIYVTVTAQVNY